MFGGAGLYADELFFALIAYDTLFFKVDDSNRDDFLRRGSKPLCPFPDKSDVSMGYYDVPADLMDDADELCVWARKSIAIARHAVTAKALRKQKSSSRKKARNTVRKAIRQTVRQTARQTGPKSSTRKKK